MKREKLSFHLYLMSECGIISLRYKYVINPKKGGEIMGKSNPISMIAWILLIIGGLHWGVIGIVDMDLIAKLGDTVARIVNILVGLSALYALVTMKKDCCGTSGSKPAAPKV